jgi:hypothetical protein
MFHLYFGDKRALACGHCSSGKIASETKPIVVNEIGAKWDRFSQQDLSGLKSKDDLVTQAVARYGFDKARRRRLKGRQHLREALKRGFGDVLYTPHPGRRKRRGNHGCT